MKRTFATLGVVGLGLITLTAPAMAAGEKVTVCHSDGSTWAPLEFNVNGLGGHDQHPLDIIPPTSQSAGKNWTAAGKALYVAQCAPLPPGEVLDPVVPPVVVDPPVTPVETPPAEEPVVVVEPVTEQPVVQTPAETPAAQTPAAVETPAAVTPAAAPAQQTTAKQPAAAPKTAPKAAPAAAPVSVGTNQGYNAQTSVGASDAGPGWLAGVGALAAAAAAVAVRRRSRPQHVAG
ncbi:outer membrane biosynthesis protein TonB [Arthrobacter sp. B2I5]|uniref:hypothetical protein n=1 Tax=Arthrobacter sp. B2I5 TaxID=3042266 RepID=UPI0027828623|nr:hypothetical protein [Arthrobacter sp. B2I5]MDQ0828004.1 outer membrane biosynthesis protein TonB [Arthrobacter sp. B2I5]